MTTVDSPYTAWMRVKKPQPVCKQCGVAIKGTGVTGLCTGCVRRGSPATVVCVLCPLDENVIPLETPRYQFVRVQAGGQGVKRGLRKVISTVCEPCWQRLRRCKL